MQGYLPHLFPGHTTLQMLLIVCIEAYFRGWAGKYDPNSAVSTPYGTVHWHRGAEEVAEMDHFDEAEVLARKRHLALLTAIPR